jgi:hypothetical protein
VSQVSQQPPPKARIGATRRRRAPRYEIKYMPPPWRRSLTESGMQRRTTRLDIAAVVMLVIALLALTVWAMGGGYTRLVTG